MFCGFVVGCWLLGQELPHWPWCPTQRPTGARSRMAYAPVPRPPSDRGLYDARRCQRPRLGSSEAAAQRRHAGDQDRAQRP
eukprot:scaffold30055_cov118-Isochrysis_galbana.AAC.5